MAYKEELHPLLEKAVEHIENIIIGKRDIAILSLAAILAKGHVLLEDVPGVGKTMMVRALAKLIGADFKRIQFTPDLLPSDVTGVSIYNTKTMEFEYRPGPIMGNIVLADEINRTSPKTQSSLLEAMEEGNVTIDGKTMRLAEPFFVMATQNPVEYEGTYPLPEAQLDRFYLSCAWAIRLPRKSFKFCLCRKGAIRLKQSSPSFLKNSLSAFSKNWSRCGWMMELKRISSALLSIPAGIRPYIWA